MCIRDSFLGGAAGGYGDAVLRIEVHGVGVVQVMVAGSDVNVQVRHFLFPKRLQLFR